MLFHTKLLLLWALALNVGSGYGFFHFDINHLLRQALRSGEQDYNSTAVATLWIEQPLDHFDRANTRSWRMRYFEDLEYFSPGGPIVLFLGGESESDPAWTQYGLLADFAKEVKGAMYVTEHRFYGESVPNDDFSVENLAYLSSVQALADIKNLLDFLKSQSKFRNSKVVVIGGSYAGNLAAWLKVEYPESVDAVWSSSAPVLAKADFYEYLEVVGDALRRYGTSDCYEKVAKIFQQYEKLLKTPEGIQQLKKELNICEESDLTLRENQQLFFTQPIVFYSSLVQYGTPNSIRSHCSENYSWENRNTSGDPCFRVDYSREILRLKDLPTKAWIYQTCTEFGYSQSTSSAKQPFTQNLPVDFFYKMCTDLFGPEFGEERMADGIKKTNERYGGLKPDVRNVVFFNGDMDPWHTLGVLEDLAEAPAIVLPSASHCSDLVESGSETETAKRMIKKWIGM